MWRISAPLRIDLGGGITDIPIFASSVGTCITSLAVDLFSDPYFRDRRGISALVSRAEKPTLFFNNFPQKISINKDDPLLFPKSILKFFQKDESFLSGFNISIFNNLPSGTGLGGSAVLSLAITVGLHKLVKDNLSKNALVNLLARAHRYEVEKLGIIGGFQDYIAAFYGGLNYINFSALEDITSLKEKYLTHSLHSELEEYFNNNTLILLLKKGNQSSDMVVADEIKNFYGHPKLFTSYLREIQEFNQKIFEVIQSTEKLEQKIANIGRLINGSWKCQKKLSNLVGQGLIKDLEKELAPSILGQRAPGAGVNSLFLLLKPNSRAKVLDSLKRYQKDILIFYPRVNNQGLKMTKFD